MSWWRLFSETVEGLGLPEGEAAGVVFTGDGVIRDWSLFGQRVILAGRQPGVKCVQGIEEWIDATVYKWD